jgi:hypothetical protein
MGVQCLRVEVTLTGAHHNEHFLHHRRRSRNSRSCELLGGAPLKKQSDTSDLFSFVSTWFEAARFGMEAQLVMALRMMRLASGGPLAEAEARQMISEKVSAFEESQVAIVTALATGGGFYAATVGAYAPYQRRVRVNRVRLDS